MARWWVIALGVVVGLAVGGERAAAKRRPPIGCPEARETGAGRYAQRALKCYAKAAATGGSVSQRCVAVAQARFLLTIQRADPSGLCFADPATLETATAVDDFVQAAGSLLRPVRRRSRCAASKLNTAGAVAGPLLSAKGRAVAAFDANALTNALVTAAGQILARFGRAEQGRCLTTGDADAMIILSQRLAGVAGRLQGQIVVSKTVRFPQPAWTDVLASRPTIEAQGYSVADDGSSITGPPQPGAGWLVTLGDLRIRTDENGAFALDVPPGTPVQGLLFHPSDGSSPVSRFLVTELAREGLPVTPLQFELSTPGACGMNVDPGDDPPACGASAPAQAFSPAGPHTHHHGEPRALNPDPSLYPPKVTGDLGTYPNEDPAATQVACLDYDGFVPTGNRDVVSYVGSTCHYYVEINCCDNERADIRRGLANVLIDQKRFPVKSCVGNHMGRFCQQITRGDVAARAKGQVAYAGTTQEILVVPGENVVIDVHNNGCYNETHVEPGYFNDLGGVLVPNAFFDGSTVRHFDESYYYVDLQLYYLTPADCPDDPDASDKYEFETDGQRATLVFRCLNRCKPGGADPSCPTTTTTSTTTTTTVP